MPFTGAGYFLPKRNIERRRFLSQVIQYPPVTKNQNRRDKKIDSPYATGMPVFFQIGALY